MAEPREERRSKYETTVLYVVQSLIAISIVASVGVGYNSRLNTAAIGSLQLTMKSFQESLHELVGTQHQTALINAAQTQQLVFMNEALKECKTDLKELERNHR